MLLPLACAWLLGLGLAMAGWLPASGPLPLPAGLLAPAALLALGGLLAADTRARLAALALAALLLGLARGAAALDRPVEPLRAYVGQTVELVGWVSAPPVCRPGWCLLAVEVEEVRDAAGRHPLADSLRVWTDDRHPPGYGQGVWLRGRLRLDEVAPSGSGPRAPAASLSRPALRSVERPAADLRVPLEQARAQLEASLAGVIPGPAGQLAAGLLLGRQASLALELRDQLRDTGTSHLLAVSGYNVALVAGFLLATLAAVADRRLAVGVGLAGVAMYTLLVGAPPSALRAALMAVLAGLAMLVGRLPDPLTSLALAAAAMAGLDPWLLGDLGFQLSCAATAGLVLLAAPLAGRWRPRPRLARWLVHGLAVTLAAQLATLPLVLHHFQSAQLVSPLANLLVQPVVPLLMALGLLALVGGWLWPLAALVNAAAQLVGGYMLVVLAWAAALPGAGLRTGGFPPWAVVTSYGLLLAALAVWRAGRLRGLAPGPRFLALGAPLAAGLALVALAADRPGLVPGELRVRFLDGPAAELALVEVGEGPRLLVGSAASPVAVGAVGERLPFLDRTVDLLVLTAAGERELAWTETLLARYPVRAVLLPPLGEGADRAGWEATVARSGATTWMVEDELSLRLEGIVEVRVVAGRAERDSGRLSVRVAYGDLRLDLLETAAPLPWPEVAQVVRLGRGEGVSPELAGRLAAGRSALVLPGPPAGRSLERLPPDSVVVRQDRTGELELRLEGPAISLIPARCPARTLDGWLETDNGLVLRLAERAGAPLSATSQANREQGDIAAHTPGLVCE